LERTAPPKTVAETPISHAERAMGASSNRIASGDLALPSDGLAKKGVLVRHLVMPGKEDEGQEIVKWLAGNVVQRICISYHGTISHEHNVGNRASYQKRRLLHLQQVQETTATRHQPTITDQEAFQVFAMPLKKARTLGVLWRSQSNGGFNI